jgi:hypothetical protein
LNLRIGERDSSPLSSVRPGGAPGRSRSAVSERGDVGTRERAAEGVVIRLSADAQRILGRREGEDDDRGPARRSDSDSAGDLISTSGRAGLRGASSPISVPPAGASDASGEAGSQAGGDPTSDQASDQTGTGKATANQAPVAGQARKLTPEDKQVVSRLSARDTAVRAHEAAHQAAASGLGGAASFTYQAGPDGRNYAVGGEVPVSLRPGRTPEETIANAQTVRSAALAPADPSAQDLAVAAQATQMEAEARQQQVRDKAEGREPGQVGDRAGAAGDRAGTVGDRGDAPTEPGSPAAAKPRGDVKPDGADKPAARDVEQDQVMIFSALKAERGGVDGGHRHLASGGSCAICSRAAARYA